MFGTVYKKGFPFWEAAVTVSLNVCSIRPCSQQSTSCTALHTELLVRVMGAGKSKHYHLVWDGIHHLEKGWKKILLIYTPGLPELYTLGRSLVGTQRGDQVHQGLNMWHTPSICTTWYSKGSDLPAILAFKQIPEDEETAHGDCQLSGPNWFAIPSAEFCLLGLYQAFNWIQETL